MIEIWKKDTLIYMRKRQQPNQDWKTINILQLFEIVSTTDSRFISYFVEDD